MTTRTTALCLVFLAAAATGCMGYREYYDRAADQYPAALAKIEPLSSSKKVRYTVNVAHVVGWRLADSVSSERPRLDALARRTIEDLRLFAPANVGAGIEAPDLHFIFDVTIESTREPGPFSGLILPFYRSCDYTVQVHVLDAKGKLVAGAVASAEASQVRHVFYLFAAPFYWPGWAESRAEKNPFEAVTVKLLAERRKFL